jgi:hypothetical protein
VARLKEDTATYLDDEVLFGSIGSSERFREAFVSAYEAISDKGVLAAAEELLGSGEAS